MENTNCQCLFYLLHGKCLDNGEVFEKYIVTLNFYGYNVQTNVMHLCVLTGV